MPMPATSTKIAPKVCSEPISAPPRPSSGAAIISMVPSPRLNVPERATAQPVRNQPAL